MSSRFLTRNEGSTAGLERACISEDISDSNEFVTYQKLVKQSDPT